MKSSLRAGDAGAVRTSLNGAAPRLLGHDGEVLTRRFGLDEPSARSETQGRTGLPGPSGTAAMAAVAGRSSAGSSPSDTGFEKK